MKRIEERKSPGEIKTPASSERIKKGSASNTHTKEAIPSPKRQMNLKEKFNKEQELDRIILNSGLEYPQFQELWEKKKAKTNEKPKRSLCQPRWPKQ